MELYQIKYFLALAETLNFTRAAERCNVSQPSLTRAVKKLEEELGGELFRRERHRTHLTELGRMVRPHLEQALALTEAAREEAADFARLVNAPLTLGVMCTISPSLLIGLVTQLYRRVPQLQLTLREDAGRRLVGSLLKGDIDVALIGLPSYPEELEIKPLYKERYVVAFPKGHRFEKMSAVPVAELADEKYLERLNCEYEEHFEQAVGEWTLPVDVRFESEHEEWIQAMILAGMGCACIPEHMTLYPGLLKRPLSEPEIWRTVSLASVRGRRHTPVVELFVRLCKSIRWSTEDEIL